METKFLGGAHKAHQDGLPATSLLTEHTGSLRPLHSLPSAWTALPASLSRGILVSSSPGFLVLGGPKDSGCDACVETREGALCNKRQQQPWWLEATTPCTLRREEDPGRPGQETGPGGESGKRSDFPEPASKKKDWKPGATQGPEQNAGQQGSLRSS